MKEEEEEDESGLLGIKTLPSQIRSESGKLVFINEMLNEFKKNGNRCLIFSQFTRMLDIVEHAVLNPRKSNYLRIDGKMKSAARQESIDKFNNDESYECFLLTSQVGSLGITLTGADRIIIIDPWYVNLKVFNN
jgi:SNF2 family DNA or RNA helicase